MFKWLGAIVENGRLARENELIRRSVTELKAELADVKQQLLAEIDSNRNREDALVDVIAQVKTPYRKLLLPRAKQKDEIEELDWDIPEPKTNAENEKREELIQMRAKDYAADYARRGIRVDFDEICRRIRENPDEYLSN